MARVHAAAPVNSRGVEIHGNGTYHDGAAILARLVYHTRGK